MNLSMWMLEHWLKEYHPVCQITSGRRCIRGIRIFVDGEKSDSDFLYIATPSNDASQDPLIMLMNKNDNIVIRHVDFNVLFNHVMEAFEYYNQLEKLLGECIAGENAEQAVISACEHLLGPTFLMSPSFDILAVSRNFTPEAVNPFWSEIVSAGKAPIEMIYSIRDTNKIDLLCKGQRQTLFQDEVAAPYSFGIMNTYYDRDNQVLGQLICASDREISPFEMQISEWMMSYIQQIPFRQNLMPRKGQSIIPSESLLKQICFQENPKENIAALQGIMQWPSNLTFRFIVLVPVDPPDKVYLNIERSNIQKEEQGFISFLHENSIVILETGNLLSEKALKKLLEAQVQYSYFAGVSMDFTSLNEAPQFMWQAQKSAAEAGAKSGRMAKITLSSFYAIAAKLLLREPETSRRRSCLHPAVRAMQKYDLENKTEYTGTLRIFLSNERSASKTSGELYVHRNTVLHRVDRIQEIWGLDLQNKAVREHLYLSLLYLNI